MICADGGNGLPAALLLVHPDIPVRRCRAHRIGNIPDKLRGFREAEIRGLREATKADVEVPAAEIRSFRGATEARVSEHDQAPERMEGTLERIDQRFDDQDARNRATVRWIIGAVLTLGGRMARFRHAPDEACTSDSAQIASPRS